MWWKILLGVIAWWLLRRLWGVVKLVGGTFALLQGLKALTGM